MKRKIISLIGIGCGALLLTGCGDNNSHILSCTQKTDGQETTITINYNEDETKAKSIKVETIVDVAEESDEIIELIKKELESRCDKYEAKSCKVTIDDKKLLMAIEEAPENSDYGSQSLKDVKKSITSSGYECK